MSKSPKWQRVHIQKCRAALGLDDPAFHLFVYQRKVVGGNKACLGLAQTNAAYQRATVMLQRGLVENDLSYEVLTHECFHAACSAQDRAVTRIIELLPKRQRAHAERLWSDGKEETATRIARGLTPLLRGMEDCP